MIKATPGKRARINLTYKKYSLVYRDAWREAKTKIEKNTVIEGLRDDLFKARVERWTGLVSKSGYESLLKGGKDLTAEHPITINSLVRHLLATDKELTQEEFENIVDMANIVNFTLSTENDDLRDQENKFSFNERKEGWRKIYKSHTIELIALPKHAITSSGSLSVKYKKELDSHEHPSRTETSISG